MDRFLSWFGLALKRDVERLEKTQVSLKNAAENLRAERDSVRIDLALERAHREVDAKRHGRVVMFMLGQYKELREKVAL